MKPFDKKKILVVEDEEHIAEGIKLNLSLQGYDVLIASNGVAALEEWKKWKPDLIVLDIMLPAVDGMKVLQSIRLEDEQIPILILSARSDVEDKIQGLTYGVDDYMTKPFNLREFLLRVERLMTRTARVQASHKIDAAVSALVPKTYTFGKNHIDFENHRADCKKGQIRLTEQEAKLLKLFISRRGQPLSRKKILEIGWGYTGGMTTRTVDNFLVRFRKYFEDDPKKPIFFKSLRSLGYIFNHDSVDQKQDKTSDRY